MAETAVKLPIHEHPLFHLARLSSCRCAGCHVRGIIHGGYYCNEIDCFVYFHKECGEASPEINHRSHPQHPLLLTNNSGDGPCDLCGEKLLPTCYSCPTCEFKVDLLCGITPSPSTIEHPLCHDHQLIFLKKREKELCCEVCKDSIGGPSFSCPECDVYFHRDCIHHSKEVNHPCHSSHPLKLIPFDTLTDDTEKTCFLCGKLPGNVLYHCSICNFTSCLGCKKNPAPLVIDHIKTHQHPLTLFSKRANFTCDACGRETSGLQMYICFKCGFAIHGGCIALPRVININRHDHRISFTPHLGAGYLNCGVCRKSLSQYHGAFSCTVCPNYAVHSSCVTRVDVWDRVELEGIPEKTEDIAPFKVVGDNLICHISHNRHTLKLHNDVVIHDERIRCSACIHPVSYSPFFHCEECYFALHEKCASLPTKKRLVFGLRPYTLTGGTSGAEVCKLCGILSGGFKYSCKKMMDVDVHRASLCEPFVHDGHIHPLYFHRKKGHYCHGCDKEVDDHVLSCDACDFDLCLYCASLPEKIWHRNDGHPLTLCCDKEEEASGTKCWCDICERQLNPSIWFYSCSDCGVSLHARCVLGDFSRLMPRENLLFGDKEIEFEVLPNNHNTRPICIQCHSRCKVSVILKDCNEDNGYICSRSCLSSYLGEEV